MSELFMLLQQALSEVRDHCFCLWCVRPAAWLGPGRERVTEAEGLHVQICFGSNCCTQAPHCRMDRQGHAICKVPI